MSTFLYFSSPIFMAIALLASLALFVQPRADLYLTLFPWFLLLGLLGEFWSDYRAFHQENNIMLTNLTSIYSVIFYLFVLQRIIRTPKMKKFLAYVLPGYILLSVINIFLVQKVGVHSMSYSLGCLLIVAACIFYFWELFQQPQSVNLVREPAFWICSGLLFYYACTFPLFGLLNFIQISKYDTIVRNLVIVLVLLNMFLNLSFTIAFLCRLKIKRSM